MSGCNFADASCDAVRTKKSVLCCGLDPQLRFMPPHLIREAISRYGRSLPAIEWLFTEFNRLVIDAVHDLVSWVKPQLAFYEIYGSHGMRAYEQTVAYARGSGLLVIADGKRNDGGDTADAYADGHIGQVPFFATAENLGQLTRYTSPIRASALTVTPNIGEDCVGRFIKRVKEYGTGIFAVTKTSFKPNSVVEQIQTESGIHVWEIIAQLVNLWGEGTEGAYGLRTVGVVMGATYPTDAALMRKILPHSWFLIPGYGAQGGGADGAVVGIREDGFGGVVNSSRGLIYPYADKQGKILLDEEGKLLSGDGNWIDLIRRTAVSSRDELVDACKKAGKWPF